jgi:2-phosphoglycerate kinase
VVYLGGAPMLGKTTAARILACRLGYSTISADDIAIAIGSVRKTDRPPIDYREYYIVNSLEWLIQDVNKGHERLWPALRTLIQKHEAWGHPVVIEGWALRPAYVHSLSGDVSGVFLLADEALIEKRVRSSDFSEGASNAELMIERFCGRSYWYNAMLREQVARLGLRALEISDGMSPEAIVDECLRMMAENDPNPMDGPRRDS